MTFQCFSMPLRWAAIAMCSVTMVGCMSVKLPAPTANPENVQALKASGIAPATTGKFALAPGKDASLDTTVGGLRGSSLTPASGTFSQYLRDEIVAELKAAGLYDEGSNSVIEAQLLDSQVDAAIGTGTGRLAAHFTVTRAGKKVYDKDLAVDAKWDSSFVGAVAIPAAMNQYGALYKSLAGKLFADPDFRAALAR